MVNAPEKKASSTALLAQPKGDVRNRAGIVNYTAHWDRDSTKDTAANTESRKEAYTDVVNGYYDGATQSARSRYFPPFSSLTPPAAQTLRIRLGNERQSPVRCADRSRR